MTAVTFLPGFTSENQRVKGIEPSCAAWEAAVLPLNYTRGGIFDFRFTIVIGSLKQFKSSLVGECRFAIHSARCARSGQVLPAAKITARKSRRRSIRRYSCRRC